MHWILSEILSPRKSSDCYDEASCWGRSGPTAGGCAGRRRDTASTPWGESQREWSINLIIMFVWGPCFYPCLDAWLEQGRSCCRRYDASSSWKRVAPGASGALSFSIAPCNQKKRNIYLSLFNKENKIILDTDRVWRCSLNTSFDWLTS